jgi:hypothetical protein
LAGGPTDVTITITWEVLSCPCMLCPRCRCYFRRMIATAARSLHFLQPVAAKDVDADDFLQKMYVSAQAPTADARSRAVLATVKGRRLAQRSPCLILQLPGHTAPTPGRYRALLTFVSQVLVLMETCTWAPTLAELGMNGIYRANACRPLCILGSPVSAVRPIWRTAPRVCMNGPVWAAPCLKCGLIGA